MRKTFLHVTMLGAGAWLIAAGCGGKVAIDQPLAAGGAGGTGSQSSNDTGVFTSTSSSCCADSVSVVSVGPSTTTGGFCGCDQFCTALEVCGASTNNCKQLCNQVPPDVRECVCTLSSCNLQACFGSGPGSGPGSTGTGGGPSGACADCANNSVEAQCFDAAEQCTSNDECIAILECHDDCGWGPACKQQCDAAHPAGEVEFLNLMECAICKSCSMPCIGTPFFNAYCFPPP